MGKAEFFVVVLISLQILQANGRGIGVQVNNGEGLPDQGDRTRPNIQASGLSRLLGRPLTDDENMIVKIMQHPMLRGRRSPYLPYRGIASGFTKRGPRSSAVISPAAILGSRLEQPASGGNRNMAVRLFRALYKDLLEHPKSYMSYKLV